MMFMWYQGRAERVLCHQPALGEDDEVDVRRASLSEGAVSTVKIDGSGWSNSIAPTGEKVLRSYL
jgi:hypothetical protein